MKKRYSNPILFGLDDGGDVVISYGNSQETYGEDPIYDFEEGITDDPRYENFGYGDFEDMDTDNDGFIDWDEFNAYCEAHLKP